MRIKNAFQSRFDNAYSSLHNTDESNNISNSNPQFRSNNTPANAELVLRCKGDLGKEACETIFEEVEKIL